MPSIPGSKALLLGLTVGLLVGALIGGPLLASTQPATAGTPQPATSYSSSGPSCYDGPDKNAGWLHVVANGETWAVTMNATVSHPKGTEIAVNVTRRPTGGYEIALTTVEATREKPLSEEGCQTATTIALATGLAEPRFIVTVNGRTIQSVDQEETIANLYPIPTPINATA